MSPIVTIRTRVRDRAAVAAARRRLDLPAPARGTAQLFGGEQPLQDGRIKLQIIESA